MADVKISALPVAGAIVPSTNVLPLVNGGITAKATVDTLVTAALNATPVTAAQGGTGITSLGTGIATFLGTPSSANLKTAVTDETGSGALVFATSPVLVTPTLGAATATTLLTGADANFTDFPNSKAVFSQANSGDSHTYNMGLVGEAVGDAADTNLWGVGVYGRGNTNVGTRGTGIIGEGGVTATGDTAASIGVRGYSETTHAGGINVGLFGSAFGGASNYSLYMANGGIRSDVTQDWSFAGGTGLTFNGGGTTRTIGVTNGAVFALGTPASGTLTNCSGLLGTGITFTGLTNATLPLAGTETLMINDGVSNKKTTVTSLQSATAYGELYVASGSVAQTSNATPEVYNKLTCFATAGLSNLTTPSAANDSITFATSGVYLISFFNTFTSSNSKVFRFRLFNETTNTAYANSVVSCSTFSTNPTFVAYSAIVSVAANDVLSVQFTSSTNSETLTITDANISATRVATS